ncbi:unnamed protein product, partial [marine sediment metagenome]
FVTWLIPGRQVWEATRHHPDEFVQGVPGELTRIPAHG